MTAARLPPAERRFVLLAAPHTSNWDLPVMLSHHHELRAEGPLDGQAHAVRAALPFGAFMKALGGLPIERTKHRGVVETVADQYRNTDELVIAIPPEATRSRAPYRRSGFHHIASAAQVPIALGFLDYEKQIGGIGPLIYPSGDVRADMDAIRTFYAPTEGQVRRQPRRPSLQRGRRAGT